MARPRRNQEPCAAQFKPELWTVVSGEKEVWATVMQDGPDQGFPCAFGLKEQMESYAKKLNETKGVLA